VFKLHYIKADHVLYFSLFIIMVLNFGLKEIKIILSEVIVLPLLVMIKLDLFLEIVGEQIGITEDIQLIHIVNLVYIGKFGQRLMMNHQNQILIR